MLPFKCHITLPLKTEPGSFGFVRKHDIHTGVDLYCEEGEPVYAIEDGEIIKVGHFTGEQCGTAWWHNTDFVLIRSKSGNILYGEIKVAPYLLRGAEGSHVHEGMFLGCVTPVLKKDKGRPMNMLHIELYSNDYVGDGVVWDLNQPCPEHLRDITPLLKREIRRSKPVLKRLLSYIGINI